MIQRLAHKDRTRQANLRLGGLLAFVAGAANAGGFLAIHRYTSHMTGIVSEMADNVVLGNISLAVAGLAALLAFTSGAATTAVLVNWARRRRLHGEFAISLMLEAVLLLVFGVLGANLGARHEWVLPTIVLLLSFIMGLQNAVVTKISQAVIRTTHMTGIVTDLGIELGRMLYWNRSAKGNLEHPVRADRQKLLIHASILGLFFGGGLFGALAFKQVGFVAVVPLALVLSVVAAPLLWRDIFDSWRRHHAKGRS